MPIRRRFLALALVVVIALPLAGCDDTNLRRVEEHVLNRIGYGPDPWSTARIRELGIGAYIEEQLSPATIDDSAIEADLASRYPMLSWGLAELRSLYNEYTRLPQYNLTIPRSSLQEARILRAAKSRRQLQEVLVDFWYNHFNVDSRVEEARWSVVTYERDAIRPHVLGRFEDLLLATARHPAMLEYLDNAYNFKEGFVRNHISYGLNENYGRELLELHTMGSIAGYTQRDVVEVARAFTGWSNRLVQVTGEDGFQYLDAGHDKGEKRIFGDRLVIPAGGGYEEGVAVIRYLARQPQTAERVARRLAQRLVSDAPTEVLVQEAKQTFLDTDGDLREVVRTLLLSAEFGVAADHRAKVKRPLHFAASLARAVGIANDADFARLMRSEIASMGEELHSCAPPTGYPEGSAAWAGTAAYIYRLNLALRATLGQYGFTRVAAQTGTPAQVADAFGRRFLHAGVSAQTLAGVTGLMGTVPSWAASDEAAAAILASPEFLTH